MLDVKELHRIADEENKKSKLQRRVEEAERHAKEDKEIMERFKKTIGEIPSLCQKAAKEGKYEVKVMELGYIDYDSRFPHNKLDYADLGPAPLMVYEWCQANDLKPELRHWHDGVGVKDGFHIYVHW